MASLARITNNFFVNLINRLGVRPPFGEGFELSNVVTPVTLVDSDISIPTVVTPPLFDTEAFGTGVASAGGTVLASTGPLAAGIYTVSAYVVAEASPNDVIVTLQHRDAADATNIVDIPVHQVAPNAGGGLGHLEIRRTLALNERLRLINQTAFGAGQDWWVALFWVLS